MGRLLALAAASWLAAASVLAAAPAAGVDFEAEQLGDAADAVPGDGACDTDAGVEGSQCTLRAAVQEANALAGPDRILLRPSRYTLSLRGAGEDGAATGDLDVTSALVVQGAGYTESLIDGRRIGDRVFDVRPGGSLTLLGAALMFGRAPKPERDSGAPAALGHGGCIRAEGPLTLDATHFYRCEAALDGGCVAALDDVGLADVLLASCRAKGEGGGLAVAAGAAATLARVTGAGCKAATGGGIATRGTLSLRNGTFTSNRSHLGGAVAALAAGSAAIARSTLHANGRSNLASPGPGAVAVTSSIVSGTKADCVGPVTSGGGNLESATACGFTGTNDQQDADPRLAPLDFDVGDVPSLALLPDSPAVDHGLDAGDACSDAEGDARALPPVLGASGAPALTDAGSFELGAGPAQPEIAPITADTAEVGVPYAFDVDTTLPARDVCRTFSLTAGPAGMTIDPATGVLAWTPGAGQLGANPATVAVDDPVGGSSSRSFLVTVSEPPAAAGAP
jgi:CSLREA domain-containing protein